MESLNINSRLEAIEEMLTATKTVLTPKEAARYMSISLSTLYKLTSAGILSYSKPNGKLIYFSRAYLDTWLLSNSSKPVEQKEIDVDTYIACR